MIEIIKNIIILILSIISGSIPIVTIIFKKYRKAKFEGIEKLARKIENLEYEKLIEQHRIVAGKSDLLFAGFLRIFCKKLNVDRESKEASYYKALILDSVRELTDRLMEKVIKENHIIQRDGDDWVEYKQSNFECILEIAQIYKDDLIGVSHKDAIEKCRDDIVKMYMKNIEPMFNEIRKVGIVFAKKIEDQEKFLTSLKNGKRKLK